MTHDEIMAMPAGRELDAMVAEKVMGQKPWYNELEGVMGVCVPPGKFKDITWNTWGMMPPYSTGITWAWEVLKHLNLPAIVGHAWNPEGGSFCTIDQLADGPQVTGLGETAPLAICRAALLTTIYAEPKPAHA